MKKLVVIGLALITSIKAMAYQARCCIDVPGRPSVVVGGEVTEFEGGIVEIQTAFQTYRTHMARVVIIK